MTGVVVADGTYTIAYLLYTSSPVSCVDGAHLAVRTYL
jgi:hypothetical protein